MISRIIQNLNNVELPPTEEIRFSFLFFGSKTEPNIKKIVSLRAGHPNIDYKSITSMRRYKYPLHKK